MNKSVYHRANRQNRIPVLPKYVEAHTPLGVYIWMVHLCKTFNFWSFVWVVITYRELKAEPTISVKPLVRHNVQFEVEEVVRVGEVSLAAGW